MHNERLRKAIPELEVELESYNAAGQMPAAAGRMVSCSVVATSS
jgi:hypothetical protein